jgi:CheY-like chemotaxis protein
MEGNKLVLVSSYAYIKRKHLSNSFEIGEGLVGQCAKEKQAILVTCVPDDYIKISSGLGEGTPRSIMVIPIQFEGQILGVLEIGKADQFSDEDTRILEQSSVNIGIAVNSSIARIRLQKLLQEAQTQEEVLRSTNEEMQIQQEELRSTNEEMQTQQEEMRVQQETLQDTNKELEKRKVEQEHSQDEIQEKNLSLEKQKVELINQREITEAKNVEVEKARKTIEEKAKELEISSKYKSEFLANMSHELRTPLNSLLILSESLADNDENNLTADQVEAAKIIHSGGKDLLNLINDILDLSKVEAGKLDISIENVSISSVFTNLNRQFIHIAKNKGVDFHIDTQYQEDIYIATDKTRLEQILKNFLSNAFKFTEKGSVTLQLSKPTGDLIFKNSNLNPTNCVGIRVIDTGMGIPKDKQMLIFEAFQQADGSISRQHGGTGLGLSISRELAKLLECEIKLESVEGKGSTFALYIPIKSSVGGSDFQPTHPVVAKSTIAAITTYNNIILPANDMASTEAVETTHVRSNKKSFLIIEDDEKFRSILLNIARTRGYDVVCTESGKEGIELARSLKPAAISLDMGLPDIDGLDVLQTLKSDPLTKLIPIHIVSGGDDLLQLYQYGAVGVSKKPMDQKKLLKVFDKIDTIYYGKTRQILVVEDDTNTQLVIAKLIHHDAIKITQVMSGEEAIKLLQGDVTYDALILDLGLPDMTGLDLLKKLQSLNFTEIPPVIVYTAKDMNKKEYSELSKFTASFILKGVTSTDRLLDDLSLFLHLNLKKVELPDDNISKASLKKRFRDILQSKHVLLVDDDLRNTFALSGALKKYGLEVTMADNGKMALEKLEETPDIQLIIMDIMMPIMDGYEAMSKIRQQKCFDNIPIVALTAKVLPEDRRKAFECGADDFLTKPVDLGKLIEIASKWLSVDAAKSQEEKKVV